MHETHIELAIRALYPPPWLCEPRVHFKDDAPAAHFFPNVFRAIYRA